MDHHPDIAWLLLPVSIVIAMRVFGPAKPTSRAATTWPAIFYAFWDPFVAWGLIAAWLLFARAYMNKPSQFWSWLNRRAYAVTSFTRCAGRHQPSASAMVAPALLKFAVTGSLTCIASGSSPIRWCAFPACGKSSSAIISADCRTDRASIPYNLPKTGRHLTSEEDSYGNEEGNQKEIQQQIGKPPGEKDHAQHWREEIKFEEIISPKYSPSAGKNVETEMREMKQGKLKSGRSGKKVTNRKQAIAIGLSEARKEGKKVPAKEVVDASRCGIIRRIRTVARSSQLRANSPSSTFASITDGIHIGIFLVGAGMNIESVCVPRTNDLAALNGSFTQRGPLRADMFRQARR